MFSSWAFLLNIFINNMDERIQNAHLVCTMIAKTMNMALDCTILPF